MRVDEHTIELGGGPVFYRRAAAAAPPGQDGDPARTAERTPLYLHTLPTSSEDFVPLLERTGGVAPDLPGFGRTSKAANLDYSFDGHAEFIAQLLDALGLEQVNLVAHGWGAAGGLTFAAAHPDRVRRLVLIDALPLLEGFRWQGLARILRTPGLGELIMGSIPRWWLMRRLRKGATDPNAWSRERLRAVWEQFDQGTQRAILRLHRASPASRLAAAQSGLGELAMPALVIWGDNDPWLQPSYAAAYAQRLPNAKAELVSNAGHWPWLDQPEVIEKIAAFLVA